MEQKSLGWKWSSVGEMDSNLEAGFRTIVPGIETETSNSHNAVRVRVLHEADLDAVALAAWQELEQNSVTLTPYLSRSFLEPAVSAKLGQHEPVYLVMEQANRWIGLGVFESVSATRAVPLPHLRSWRTEHTFLDGMLLRTDREEAALTAFWEFMQQGTHPWYAVEFGQLAEDDFTTNYLGQTAVRAGVECRKGAMKKRASLDISAQSNTTTDSSGQGYCISTRRARSLRRGWNWLSKHGEVAVRVINKPNQIDEALERFLELEAMGWKSDEGTAMAVDEIQKAFLQDLVERFSEQNRVFFLELTVDDIAIASVIHFVAGDVSYSFKLGWNPRYSRGCPGYQIKAQSLFFARQLFPHLRMVDSCACPGSFIEHVWAGRREIMPRIFLCNQASQIVCSLLDKLRWIRNQGVQLFTSMKQD